MDVAAVTTPGFAVFATAIGPCAIGWNERGVTIVQLPEGDEAAARARMRRRWADAKELVPPPEVARAVEAITALLRGEAIDLSFVQLDMERTLSFERSVYERARSILPGQTRTYGEIARELGGPPGSARAVGQALGRNPFALVVPCHRVLAADGGLGGFSARGGVKTKQRLLAIEGAKTCHTPGLFDED
jgi:methylated-DNA-[protein]-cysteine S-methyltransferase